MSVRLDTAHFWRLLLLVAAGWGALRASLVLSLHDGESGPPLLVAACLALLAAACLWWGRRSGRRIRWGAVLADGRLAFGAAFVAVVAYAFPGMVFIASTPWDWAWDAGVALVVGLLVTGALRRFFRSSVPDSAADLDED